MNPQKLKELEVKMLWRDYDELSNKRTDWLIASWKQKGDKKEDCIRNYKKYKRLSKEAFTKWMKAVEID